jgi:hypothetical protein
MVMAKGSKVGEDYPQMGVTACECSACVPQMETAMGAIETAREACPELSAKQQVKLSEILE